MISDTLSEAVSTIEGYLRDFPAVYAAVKPQVEQLICHMDHIRSQLDSPNQPAIEEWSQWIKSPPAELCAAGFAEPLAANILYAALQRIAFGPAFSPGTGDSDDEVYMIGEFAKERLRACVVQP